MFNISLIAKSGSSVKKELMAGISTYLTMVYIAIVNPHILQQAGLDQGAVFTATCLVTALGCALTGFMANIPIAVAPGMALNVYFTYSVVQTYGFDWQHALAMVFISGALFLIVCLTRMRVLLIEAIPHNLQVAILVGISMLIALIALQSNGLIISGQHALLQLGDLAKPQSVLFFLGFLLILTLDYFKIQGAIVLGILAITILSFILGLSKIEGFFSLPPSISPTFMALDFSGMGSSGSIKAVFAFFLIAVFDATGTLVGLLNQSMFKSMPNYPNRLKQSLTADAIASTAAGILGSSSTSPYIESAAGIKSGGRTGLTTIIVAIGFLCTLFIFPIAKSIPPFATGPALLYVAVCMMRSITELDFDDITNSAPAILTIMMIPFTASIADGIGFGIISFALLKILTRKPINYLTTILAAIFVIFFIIS